MARHRHPSTACVFPQVNRNLLKIARTIASVAPDCAPAGAGASSGLRSSGIAKLMKQHSVKQPVESTHQPRDTNKFAHFNRAVAAKGNAPAESAFLPDQVYHPTPAARH